MVAASRWRNGRVPSKSVRSIGVVRCGKLGPKGPETKRTGLVRWDSFIEGRNIGSVAVRGKVDFISRRSKVHELRILGVEDGAENR